MTEGVRLPDGWEVLTETSIYGCIAVDFLILPSALACALNTIKVLTYDRTEQQDIVSYATKELTRDGYRYTHIKPDHDNVISRLVNDHILILPGQQSLTWTLRAIRYEGSDLRYQGRHTDISLLSVPLLTRYSDSRGQGGWIPSKFQPYWGEWAEILGLGKARWHTFNYPLSSDTDPVVREHVVLFVHPDKGDTAYMKYLVGRRRRDLNLSPNP